MIVNGNTVAESEVACSNIRFSYTFDEPGKYPIEIQLIDPAGQSDVVAWTVLAQGEKPEITDTLPAENEPIVLAGTSQVFEVSADVSSGSVTYSWEVNGAPSGTGNTLDYQFTEPGEYLITASASGEGDASSTHSWQVNVQAFRSPPVFSEQSSGNQVTADSTNELLTFSVRNPDINDQSMSVEIVTTLPDGVSITNAQDVSEGDAGIQALVGTVPPGRQASMQLAIDISRDIEQDSIIIPYEIRYYPEDKREQYRTVQNQSIDLNIKSGDQSRTGSGSEPIWGTGDSVPGFGVLVSILSIGIILMLASKKINN